MPKELTRHQLSSRIAYDQNVPSFLRKMRAQVAGTSYDDPDSDPDRASNPDEDNGDGELDEFGRQRRPNRHDERGENQGPSRRSNAPADSSALGRPSIPERPADDPGSADEDYDEELPQIVVLKEGKHLSATEVENERRKTKGLAPLPDLPMEPNDFEDSQDKEKPGNKKKASSLNPSSSSKSPQSFVSIGSGAPKLKSSNLKRKALAHLTDRGSAADGGGADIDTAGSRGSGGDIAGPTKLKVKDKSATKKAKKQKTGLLSFGDDG